MENESLNPQQSFELIARVIQDAKSKFEEDGVIYIMWGILMALAAGSQFYLLTNGYMDINYYPYFLMPLGVIVSYFYYSKKAGGRANYGQIGRISYSVWIVCSINILILGFGLFSFLTTSLTPIILILLGIALSLSGVVINSSILLFSGIFTNVAGIVCFFIDWIYQPLMLVLVALVAVLIPGILLLNKHRKSNV